MQASQWFITEANSSQKSEHCYFDAPLAALNKYI